MSGVRFFLDGKEVGGTFADAFEYVQDLVEKEVAREKLDLLNVSFEASCKGVNGYMESVREEVKKTKEELDRLVTETIVRTRATDDDDYYELVCKYLVSLRTYYEDLLREVSREVTENDV